MKRCLPVLWILFCSGISSHFIFAQSPGLNFIENKCQWPEAVQYAAHAQGTTIELGTNGFSYVYVDQRPMEELHHGNLNPEHDNREFPLMFDGHRVQVSFAGANEAAIITPFDRQPAYYNYFIGDNAATWSSNVPAFSGVVYHHFYPGIDLKVYSQGMNMKYEFIVAPGGDLSQINWKYEGIAGINVIDDDLVVNASLFSFIEKAPVIYQYINGEMKFVKGGYELNKGLVRFCLDELYDPCYPLIIDPVLIFSTYSGSSADNWGSTATPGENGTLYSAGVTNLGSGGSYPATPGAFQISYGGFYDVGILKYDSTGSQLLYASYLGGSGSESPHSLVVNHQQELLVLGTTGSDNFPTTVNAFDRTYNGGSPENNVIQYQNGSDIFVARISRSGNTLIASTFLGGSANDGLNPTNSPLVANYGDQLRGDIIADANDNIFISTVTASNNFPVANSFGTSYRGGATDALLIHIRADLSQIIWASFLGGSGADASHTIKFDPDNNLIVGGGTGSDNFTVTAGAYQTVHNGFVDGWVARVAADGSQVITSTFTGTNAFDQVYFIDLDTAGNIYAFGQTNGTFPVTAGVYRNNNSGQFLQKFNSSLSTLIFSTVFGAGRGLPDISPTAFLVNDCNNIFLSGWGGSINNALGFWQSSTVGLPVTADAFQKTTSGSDFYFIVLSGDASQLLYATFLGGLYSKTHVDGGTSRFDKSGVVYHAVCSGCAALNSLSRSTSDFPTTANAWSRINRSVNCNNAAFKFDLSLLKARIQTNSITLKQPGLGRVCIPDKIVFQNLSTGGQFFEWDFGDGQTIMKTDTGRIIHQYLVPGIYRVKLTAIDFGTCQGLDSTFTSVSVAKSTGFAGPDQVICFGVRTNLMAGGGVLYQWQSADNSFTSTQQTPSVNPEKDTRYFVTITDANNCQRRDTVDVKVVPGIDMDFTFTKTYSCEGRPTLLVENISESDLPLFFDFGDGATSDLTMAQHNYEKDGTYAVRLVGVRESCVFDVQKNVPVYTVFIPNVITPDEFPENNAFQILYGGRPISQSWLVAMLKVYNRWGRLVYESDNYQDDWMADNVETGVYYYELIVEDEFTCKGWIHIVK
jgi:hypothetical protein